MTTKHRKITERHLVADVLGITCGSFIVDAVSHRSWTSGVVALVLGFALWVIDRIGIENEEAGDK